MNNLGGLFIGSQNSPAIETGYNPQQVTRPLANTLAGTARVNQTPATPHMQTTAPWSVMPPLSAGGQAAPAPLSNSIYIPPVARGFPPNVPSPANGIPVQMLALGLQGMQPFSVRPRGTPLSAHPIVRPGMGPRGAVRSPGGAGYMIPEAAPVRRGTGLNLGTSSI